MNNNIYMITCGEMIKDGKRKPTFIKWNTQTGETWKLAVAKEKNMPKIAYELIEVWQLSAQIE